jgi:hypothetical protein
MKRYGMPSIPNKFLYSREPFNEWQTRDRHGALTRRLRHRARMQAKEELRAMAAMPDDQIDTTDAPELADWSGAQRGLFYRPAKEGMA